MIPIPENLDVAVSTPFSEYNIPIETTMKATIVKTINPKSVLSNSNGLFKPIHWKKPEHFLWQSAYQTNELM